MGEIRDLFKHDRVSMEIFDIRYNWYKLGNSYGLRNLWKYCRLPDEVVSIMEMNDLISYDRIEKAGMKLRI